MANLVLASKREFKSGSFWHVYRSENNKKSDELYIATPLKALRYAFILRKRFNAIIPKGVYGKLMADVKASKAQAEQEPSTAQAEASENTAPEQATESKPKRTNKKASTEPNTESK